MYLFGVDICICIFLKWCISTWLFESFLWFISILSCLGGRKHQEDRFTVCPALMPSRRDTAFFGVFDGTVGKQRIKGFSN